MATGIPWVDGFSLRKGPDHTTISGIGDFLNELVTQPDDHRNEAAQHLVSLLEKADLQFSVKEEDVNGDSIKTSLIAIMKVFGSSTHKQEIERRVFWTEQVTKICLMMAERLVVYRQEVNPSEALTSSLLRYVLGLQGFVMAQSSPEAMGTVNTEWQDLVQRLRNDRTNMNVTHQEWHSRVVKLSRSPLALIESFSDELKRQRNRKAHGRSTLAKIVELQGREINTLSTLRKKLEAALEDSACHKSPTHLFSAKTYMLATTEIDSVLAAPTTSRSQLLMLMQKKFELLALNEVEDVGVKAVSCYKKIYASLDSSSTNVREKCLLVIEEIMDLYWLQRKTLNKRHGDVKVDKKRFKQCLKAIILNDGSEANSDTQADTDMWKPSLMKLDGLLQSGNLNVDSIQLVYDAILVPTYAGAMVGGHDDLAVKNLVPVNTAVQTAVVRQRDVVRALMIEVMRHAAQVTRRATLLDARMSEFVECIMNPFLVPIRNQWNAGIEDYLKPISRDHDDEVVLGKANTQRDDDKLEQTATQQVNSVAASLASNTIFILQIIKAIRLFIQIGAGFVAQKVFNESYVRKVFSEGRDPPDLTNMLFLMLSIDATAHLMLVILLVLSSFVFKTETNQFIVDDIFLAEVLTEFAISSLVLIILGMMVSNIMRTKRYFQYADQGQVVSTAFKTALMYICVINFVVPFSLLVS